MPAKTALAVPLVLALVAGCVSTENEFGSATGSHVGMESQFTQADADRSGFVTREEIATLHHDEMLAQYDLDRDNHVSLQEWETAHPTAAQTDAKFNLIDRDGDKKISKSEAVKWVSEHVTFTKSFAKYDLDGDSRLYWKNLEEKAPTELRVTIFSLPI